MTTHAAVHLDASLPERSMFTHHWDGRVSVAIADDDRITVWLTATPDELRRFAADLAVTVGQWNPQMAPAPGAVAS